MSVQVYFLFLTLIVKLANGDLMPYLSNEEHKRYSQLIQMEITKQYPSDGDDKAEIVKQEYKEDKRLTLYKSTKADKAVFVSSGNEDLGKDVVVLLRGADYLDPFNKLRFIVLRKRGGGSDYNVHVCNIWVDHMLKPHVHWSNAAISMIPNLGKVIQYLFQPFFLVEKHTDGMIRPECAWFGYILLCDSKETVIGDGGGGGVISTPKDKKKDIVNPSGGDKTGTSQGNKDKGGSGSEVEEGTVVDGSDGGGGGEEGGEGEDESSEELRFVVHKGADGRGTVVYRNKLNG